jgi:ribonuclease P protein subunit POP4
MKHRIKDIRRHELIGLPVMITKSSNPTLVGIEGEVIDETKNTLKIRTESGVKQVLKDICTFDFEGVQIEGSEILGRPENRLKKVKK